MPDTKDKVATLEVVKSVYDNVVTAIRFNSESLRRTGVVNITPASIGLESLSAASSGTALSLVTTGEKYSWNNRVAKGGDTMTGNLYVKKDIPKIVVQREVTTSGTTSALECSLYIGADNAYHGVYSNGYRDGDGVFHSDSRWMVYRSTAGTIAVNGNCTGNAATATRATNDSDGNAINTTYLKKIGGSMSGDIDFGQSGSGTNSKKAVWRTYNNKECSIRTRENDFQLVVDGTAVLSIGSNKSLTLTDSMKTAWRSGIGLGNVKNIDQSKAIRSITRNGTSFTCTYLDGTTTENAFDQRDNNTTYSAGNGLTLSGTTFSNSGVTGVKGNNESTYRTGSVNLTPANLGLSVQSEANGGTTASLVTTGDRYRWNRMLPLSGGNMSGVINFPTDWNYASTPGSFVSKTLLEVTETNNNNNIRHQIYAGRYTDGRYATTIQTRKSSDVNNYISIYLKEDGTKSYGVGDQGAFRNAIGASSGVWPISTGGTGATIDYNAVNNLGAAHSIYISGSTYSNIYTELIKIQNNKMANIYLSSDAGSTLTGN